jgi:meiotically up-regulated gene 157 (Mug157) protein
MCKYYTLTQDFEIFQNKDFFNKSSFRNIDDSSIFPYNIPENCLLVSTFKLLLECFDDNNIFKELKEKFEPFKKDIKNTIESVEKAIYEKGVIIDPNNGEKYFAFEIDGYGNYYFMDEPGYPSLISLPFFNFCPASNEIYINTRKRILSERNPYFIKGKYGKGCSSSHSYRKYNWPLFTIMQGLTSIDKEEIKYCLKMLIESAGDKFFMHESYDIDDADKYTREWFAWANSFFGVFIDFIIEKYPELIF